MIEYIILSNHLNYLKYYYFILKSLNSQSTFKIIEKIIDDYLQIGTQNRYQVDV